MPLIASSPISVDIGSQQGTKAPPDEPLVVKLSSPEITSEQDEGTDHHKNSGGECSGT